MTGYYREPTLWKNHLIFVCEDDLWLCPLNQGRSQRITDRLGSVHTPSFSHDGKWIAFTGTAEGHREVYVMAAEEGHPTGQAQRLTFLDSSATVIGWSPEGHILFSSPHESAFLQRSIYSISPEGGVPCLLPVGPANFLSIGPEGRYVIQRHGYGYYSWKRYQGGTAGEIWVEKQDKSFQLLLDTNYNTVRPLWIENRIYFASDYEGHGNLYSCTESGTDLKRHTHHNDFYVRGIATDGIHIVYNCQGRLWCYSLKEDKTHEILFEHYSSRPQCSRALKSPAKHLTSYSLSPNGQNLSITTRGRLFRLTTWKGPVSLHGETDGVRYRISTWLHKGEKIVAVKDQGREEILEIYVEDPLEPAEKIEGLDWGRILSMQSCPISNQVLITNHRHELLVVNLDEKTCRPIDRDPFHVIDGYDWSPDGKWIVYSFHISRKISILKLYNFQTGETIPLTQPVGKDFSPCFDESGKFIFFLSNRTFYPIRDQILSDMSFHNTGKPYLITLQSDTPSPFLPHYSKEEEKIDEKSESKDSRKEDTANPEIMIDTQNIQDRILEFPIKAGVYHRIASIKGKALYFSTPSLIPHDPYKDEEDESDINNDLDAYDFSSLKTENLVSGIDGFTLSRDRQWIAYNYNKQLRVIKAGERPEETDLSYKAGGLLDWSRICLSVQPHREWRHMFHEAWRLQKELFWQENMSHIDWNAVYDRYQPLVDRVATRLELLDLIEEMQGELGSSHAYIFSTQISPRTDYSIGQLGARMSFIPEAGAWQIESFHRGDVWNPQQSSPLLRPGLNIHPGDLIWAVCGQKVSEHVSPNMLLHKQTGQIIPLVVSDNQRENKRTIWVTPLSSESIPNLLYRDWVQSNRAYVQEKTDGRVGYIHIPDMGSKGFSEFIRSYTLELSHEGLIIDSRFNRGGNISNLILEKLFLKRIGLDQSRWQGLIPYPEESPRGPMVALCNEYTSSDGDIFCQSFKSLKLGPLIGKRTWGGVIGIWPRNPLIDGTVTSQPEYSFWFHDVGWSIENHGVEPDIAVDIPPGSNQDTQLERSITEILKIMNNKHQDPLALHPDKPGPNLAPPILKNPDKLKN